MKVFAIIPKMPYNTKLITMEAIKAEYLASGPKFSTACDLMAPGVIENNVCEASSGMNGNPINDLNSSATPIAMEPDAKPATKALEEVY